MGYLANISTSLQFISEDNNWNGLLKSNVSALEVGGIKQCVVNVTSGVISVVDTSGLSRLQALGISANNPIDLSLRTDGSDLFLGLETKTIILVEPTGVIFDHIKIRSSTDSTVELAIAGLFT